MPNILCLQSTQPEPSIHSSVLPHAICTQSLESLSKSPVSRPLRLFDHFLYREHRVHDSMMCDVADSMLFDYLQVHTMRRPHVLSASTDSHAGHCSASQAKGRHRLSVGQDTDVKSDAPAFSICPPPLIWTSPWPMAHTSKHSSTRLMTDCSIPP